MRGRSLPGKASSLVVVLLLSLFAALIVGARLNALTADEPAYVAGGYAWLKHPLAGYAFLAQRGYPPLLTALEALPLYLGDARSLPVVEQLTGWPDDFDAFSFAFAPYLKQSIAAMLATRFVTIWLTLLLAAVVFRWSSDLATRTNRSHHPWRAGLLALGALTFDPTLLALGRLAHSDAGAVALGTTSLFLVWRWARKATWPRAIAAGGVLGLTLLAKVSGPIWLAAALVMLLAALATGPKQSRAGRLTQSGVMLVLAGGLWWAAYGFTWEWINGLPVPAPAYWESIAYLRTYITDIFALGLRQTGKGWWWYFPVAFLIKNPLPLLLALLIALAAWLRRPQRPNALTAASLLVFPALYTLIAIMDGMNIGYRHMLPIHPFLWMGIGVGLHRWLGDGVSVRHWRAWVVSGLAIWLALTVVRVYPWEISYFNELAGGPENGYRFLADSNVDWGQADYVRDAYLTQHPAISTAPPATPFNPAAGTYLVSATKLQGTGVFPVDTYEWFRHRVPETILAYSQRIYQVDAANQPVWLAQCNQPTVPLPDPVVDAKIGLSPQLRRWDFNCTKSWIYPAGGASNGLIAVRHVLLTPNRFCWTTMQPCQSEATDTFLARRLSDLHLSYDQIKDSELPAFALYEQSAQPLPISSVPVAFNGPLTFLAAKAYQNGEELEVETWWQVMDGPIDNLFSIMAHITTAQGDTLAVDDGIGISPLALETGDILVERHRFTADSAAVQLRTGAYWLDETITPWTLADAPDQNAILLNLADLLR